MGVLRFDQFLTPASDLSVGKGHITYCKFEQQLVVLVGCALADTCPRGRELRFGGGRIQAAGEAGSRTGREHEA